MRQFARLLFLICLICYILPGWAQQTCLPDAVYHFNYNASDSSSNGLNGIVNNAVLTTDRYGYANRAYSFDGNTSYIDLGNSPLLKKYAADFSVSAWIFMRQYSVSYGSAVISNRGGNSDGSTLTIGGELQYTGKAIYTVSGGATSSFVVSATLLQLNQWYQLTATYQYNSNNTNILKIYINGILDTTANIDDIQNPTTVHTYIGFEPSPLVPAEYHFNGIIDEVKIYNCVLSKEDAKALYKPVTSVTKTDVALPFSGVILYPNPSTGIFHISDPKNEILSFDLYAPTGEEILTGVISNTIDLSTFGKGMYFLQLRNKDNASCTKKLIIEQ